MEVIRERHKKTQQQLKQVLVESIQERGIEGVINWEGFEFQGKAYRTMVRGQIFDQELYIEISGWFEKKAVRKFRKYWKDLLTKGLI